MNSEATLDNAAVGSVLDNAKSEEDVKSGESINKNIEESKIRNVDKNSLIDKNVAEILVHNSNIKQEVDSTDKDKNASNKNNSNVFIKSTKHIEEGCDAHEEEMLLKEEDEDEENAVVKYDENAIDEDALLANDTDYKEIITTVTSEINEQTSIILIDNYESKALAEQNKVFEKSSMESSSIKNEVPELIDLDSKNNTIDNNFQKNVQESIGISKVEVNIDYLKVKEFPLLQTHNESIKEQENIINITEYKKVPEIDGRNTLNQNVVNLIPGSSIISEGINTTNTTSEIGINDNNTVTAIIDNISPENTDISEHVQSMSVDEEVTETISAGKTKNEENTLLKCDIPVQCPNKEQTLGQIERGKNIPNKNADEAKIIDSQNNTIIMKEVESLVTCDLNLCSTPEIKRDHAIKKPDVMLEIPTQELIDIDIDSTLEEDIPSELELPLIKPVIDDLNENDDSHISSIPDEDMSVDNLIQSLEDDNNLEESNKDNFLQYRSPKEELVKQDSRSVVNAIDISKSNDVKSDFKEIKNSGNIFDASLAGANSCKESADVASHDISEYKDNEPSKYHYYYDDTDAQIEEICSNNKKNIFEEQKLSERNISEALMAVCSPNTEVYEDFEKKTSCKQQNRDEQKDHTKTSDTENSLLLPVENKLEIKMYHEEQNNEVKEKEHIIKLNENDKTSEETLTKQTTETVSTDNTVRQIVASSIEDNSSIHTSKALTSEETSTKDITLRSEGTSSEAISSDSESSSVSKTLPVTYESLPSITASVSHENTPPHLEYQAIISKDTKYTTEHIPVILQDTLSTSDTIPLTLETMPTPSTATLSTKEDIPLDLEAIKIASEAVLSTSEAVPSISEAILPDLEVTSSSTEAILPTLVPTPSTTEALPSTLQAISSTTEVVPSDLKAILSTSDTILSSPLEARISISEDVSPTTEAKPSISKIRPSTLEAIPTALEGTTLPPEAIPPISESITLTTKDVPSVLQAIPCTSDTTLSTLEAAVSISEDLPPTLEVLPSISKILPSMSKAMPSALDISPSSLSISSEDLKTITSTTKAVPSVLQDIPSATEAVSPASEVIPSTSEVIPSTSEVVSSISIAVPSTSKTALLTWKVIPSSSEVMPSISAAIPSTSQATLLQPSSPKIDLDISDENLEIEDSLGLLAETSRVMDDDEEIYDDECDDDDDLDIDDESSNHMTAEHSEDSNAPNSENEQRDSIPVLTSEKEDIQMAESRNHLLDEHSEVSVMNSEDNKLKEDGKKKTEKRSREHVKEKEKIQNDNVTGMESHDIDITDHITVEETIGPVEELAASEEVPKDDKNNRKEENAKIVSGTDETKNKIEDTVEVDSPESCKKSPDKLKNFTISNKCHYVNYVDLEESSSEDDVIVEDTPKEVTADTEPPTPLGKDVMTMVNISQSDTIHTKEIEDNVASKEGDDEIQKPNESTSDKDLDVSKNTVKETTDTSKPKMGMEIFNLDSDDEESKEEPKIQAPEEQPSEPGVEETKHRRSNKCINLACRNRDDFYYRADSSLVAYYDAGRKKRPIVCESCVQEFTKNRQALIEGVKNMTPLLDLHMGNLTEECVEISDSESEEEGDLAIEEEKEIIGETGAKLLEDSLAQLINDSWKKYKMDARLDETTELLNQELDRLDADSKDIDLMLKECQTATDKLRMDLYATFEPQRKELPAIIICDTPTKNFTCNESCYNYNMDQLADAEKMESRRRPRTRKVAIPPDYVPLNDEPHTPNKELNKEPKPLTQTMEISPKADEDKDVSVVQLSAEVAPPDLPPCGDVLRPQLKVGLTVYAVRNTFAAWLKARILELTPRGTKGVQYTMCRIKFESSVRNPFKVLSARDMAYEHPSNVRLTIGTRVIALFKDSANDGKRESFYSGIIAEVPTPVNNYRYLVFFDDGYAQYVLHKDTRLVCESSPVVWDEVHPFSREFVKKYLLAYPERPMVRLHAGQSLKTEWNGKWWTSKVVKVDASLVQVHFEEDNRTEWIYRGSTRLAPLYLELQAAQRHRNRPLPRSKAQTGSNMPYVEYTRPDETNNSKETDIQVQQRQEEIRRQRAVAKKSTATTPAHQPPANVESALTTRVVYYTPKNAVKPHKMVAHQCSIACKRTDVLGLKELRTYNPLAKPLLSGWERQIARYKGQKGVMYRAPCGRRLRNMRELHAYLRAIHSDMAVDLFDFNPNTHCLAEFVVTKCLVGKKDLSHGRENVPVPCVNTLDETLPEFCSYNTERVPTTGVPLNLDPDFLCGCDCTDDCEDKSRCACWQMTLEGAKTIGLEGPNIGYVYKRLPEPLPSGIYECNSRCKCKNTCLNRVAQHPLQLKLQVFKTLSRGWGIRALNDVPAGSFLCVYAGNLLTDATANLDGLNEGDEYLAELDYIEVVEQMKEGYEDDIPEADKKLDEKGSNDQSSDAASVTSEEGDASNGDKQDDDFQPGYGGDWCMGNDEQNRKTLRKREKKLKKEKEIVKEKKSKEANQTEDCITISDDEEIREPARFTAQLGMGAKEFVSKYRSVRAHFGKDESCYIMDAKVQGNIGRYLNHSCSPNVFVQNVFVDTHDPRFPWVAFFALSHIRAGTELTWNYNYDVGSVPGKVLYCHCGAANCRGRLL